MRPTILLLIVLAAATAVSVSAAVSPAVVATVTDGATVRLADGRRVRLLQIDTPELGTGECYSRAGFKVIGTDPHGFDGDRDGVGCET